MKKGIIIIISILINVCIVHTTFSQETIITAELASKKIEKWKNDVFNQLDVLKSKAIREGNIALEQRILQIEFAVQSSIELITKNANLLISELDPKVQSYIQDLQNTINQILNDADNLVDKFDILLNNNLNDLCAKFSLICSKDRITYSLNRIDNTTITFGTGTQANIGISGSVLNDKSQVIFYLQEQKVNSNQITMISKNNWNINLPISSLPFSSDAISRPKICLLVVNEILNPEKKWYNFLKPDYVLDTFRLKTNLILLPKSPLRIELWEVGTEDVWQECSTCKDIYEGKTVNQKISNHYLEIAPDYRLNSVIKMPERRYDVPGSSADKKKDHYIFQCTTPKEITIQGKKKVHCKCFDAAVNRSCAPNVQGYYNSNLQSEREKLIDYHYPCSVRPLTNRDVIFEIKMDKLVKRSYREPLIITESESFAENGLLNYGDHYSKVLRNNSSDFEIKIYPTWTRDRDFYKILTSVNNEKAIDNVTKVKAIKEKFGSNYRILISVESN